MLEFQNVKTLTQLQKAITILHDADRLKLWIKGHGHFVEFFLDNDHLLCIKTDMLNSGCNSVELVTRSFISDAEGYDVIRRQTNKNRITGRGFMAFWQYIEKISLSC